MKECKRQRDLQMSKKLLIDAHQPEETRVVLLNDQKIEEFDYENTARKQLKGNVYLARVTRVEPSLQAAFVEYGGNRQGFLAFSEIHPDYYRIPIEDREALKAEEEPADDEEEETSPPQSDTLETIDSEEEITTSSKKTLPSTLHKYKIQEVISRKQILLIQVVKEERGNKGAALTTYLSLAGRYCVLMPNSNRGGGVSRKINNPADRKRLKSVVSELDITKGMAVIVRTAGSKRTKTEIKRDYSYLTKLWNDIRTKTMESEAPCLIHEEGSLVKRAIRDIYTNDIEEVYVEGADSYRIAKTHMKMLIPSHAKRIFEFKGDRRLFQQYQVEDQLAQIHHNEVTLKSGGYLVLNQTEALVAIDVNSGKATKERNIEETAVKTNLEAAEEIGRQLKLRDLSGLVVIDFIDMEEHRNQHLVERKLKEALRNDRARIQVGGISHFGLLEMSRQRLRPSLVESISQVCPHCEGTGRVRSVNSSALHILRILEEEIVGISARDLAIVVQTDIALYILNEKRATLAEIETKANCKISIQADASLLENDYRLIKDNVAIESKEKTPVKAKQEPAKTTQNTSHLSDDEENEDGEQPKRKRRGRRGGRRRRRRDGDEAVVSPSATQSSNGTSEPQNSEKVDGTSEQNNQSSNRQTTDGQAVTEENSNADANSDKANIQPKPRKRRGGKTKQNKTASSSTVDSVNTSNTDVKAATPNSSDLASPDAPKPKQVRGKTSNNLGAADAEPNNDLEKTVRPKAKAKKAAGKKAANKTVAKKKTKSAKQHSSTSENQPVVSEPQKTSREPIASVDLGVTDVGNNAPASKKRGWWSKG